MKNNSLVKRFFIFLTSLIIAFVAISYTPRIAIAQKSVSQSAIANYFASQQNANLSDEEKIKIAIETYFTLRYESQKTIKAQNFSSLLADERLEWVQKEKDKREIELYIASLFNLGYQSYKYSLDFDTIEIKNSQSTVYLRESHEVVFNAIAPDVSYLANLPHVFTLHKKKGTWVIYKDKYDDELTKQLKHSAKSEIKKQVDINFANEQNANVSFYTPMKVLAMPMYSQSTLVNNSYDRLKAIQYANKHWLAYNTNWYKTNPSTDCTSFVSQVLYAGESKIPPDTSGMTTSNTRSYNTDWYYVFNNPAGTQNGSGSLPWVRVQAQYTFITTNTSKIGPYGTGTTNICSVKRGDIVQLKGVNTTGVWDHEGVIVYAPTTCSSLNNYKVNAHTTNRYYYPLSNWASYPMRYIVIKGWRGN